MSGTHGIGQKQTLRDFESLQIVRQQAGLSMNTNKSIAHLAGSYYVLLIITGIFSLIYVPSQLIVSSDAVATVANLKASEFLFRLGIVAGLACQVLYVLLPLTLYKLLKSVNEQKARLMAILALVSVPVSLIAYTYKFNVLTLLGNANYLTAINTTQLQTEIMLQLASFNNAIHVASIFWGLWLFPFGYLVYKSGFLPKFFGIFLMLGCIGYLIKFLCYTIWPTEYMASGLSSYIGMPSAIGEIGIGFWLLIMGAKELPNK